MNNQRGLTLEQLRIFVCVVEHSSFTKAAAVLKRTQPALTHQIRSIEDNLDVKLILRSSGRIGKPTEAGEILLHRAKEILSNIDKMWEEFQTPELSGTIRLGVMDDIDAGWLFELVNEFTKNHPKFRVQIISDLSNCLEASVDERQIDVAIVKSFQDDKNASLGLPLKEEPLEWCVGHNFDTSKYEALPLVMFKQGCVYRDFVEKVANNINLSSYIVYEGRSYANVKSAIFSGFGVGVLPISQVKAANLITISHVGRQQLPKLGSVCFRLNFIEHRLQLSHRQFIKFISDFTRVEANYARLLDNWIPRENQNEQTDLKPLESVIVQ